MIRFTGTILFAIGFVAALKGFLDFNSGYRVNNDVSLIEISSGIGMTIFSIFFFALGQIVSTLHSINTKFDKLLSHYANNSNINDGNSTNIHPDDLKQVNSANSMVAKSQKATEGT